MRALARAIGIDAHAYGDDVSRPRRRRSADRRPASSPLAPASRKPGHIPRDADNAQLSAEEAGRPAPRSPLSGSGSSLRIWPTASTPGHSCCAAFRLGHGSCCVAAVCSVVAKPRPRTRSIPRTPKYSGETNWYATVDLPVAASANAGTAHPDRPARMPPSKRRTARSSRRRGSPSAAARSGCRPSTMSARANAGIDCRGRPRAAQEDGSTDEEQHGSGHLEHDERVPRAAGTGITHHFAAHGAHQLQPAWPEAPARARRTASRPRRRRRGTARRASPPAAQRVEGRQSPAATCSSSRRWRPQHEP